MKKTLAFLFLSALVLTAGAQNVPSFEQVISLRNAGFVTISPDGTDIAYTVQTTDWVDNRYDTEIWLSKDGKKPFQLTNNPKGSSTSPAWSPDGKWISFLSDRGNKNQIYVISVDGGEARPVTAEEESISRFIWLPSGEKIVFLKPEKADKDKKEMEKKYGLFSADDADFTLSHLWQISFDPFGPVPSEVPCYETIDSLNVAAGCIVLPKPERLTDGKFTVTSFLVSPDGSKIAFGRQPDPLINSSYKSDIWLLDLNTKNTSLLVGNRSSDNLQEWRSEERRVGEECR